MTPDPQLLTTAEVAELCKVDPETVRLWARRGRIQTITLPGGQLRFRRQEIDRILTPTTEPGVA